MKIKSIVFLLVAVIGFSLVLTACNTSVKYDSGTHTDSGANDTNSGNINSDNTGSDGSESSSPDDNVTEDVILSVLDLPDGHIFSSHKSKTYVIPKKINITECYFWQDYYYYFVELNDDNNDRLYYKTDRNYIEEGEKSFVIPIGDAKLYFIYDRTVIDEFGYGFEPVGGELVLLKPISTEQYFEWNGSWYYYYDENAFADGSVYVRSDIPYHLEGMKTFWLKGWANYYKFVVV